MMTKIQYVPLRKGQMDKYLEMAKRAGETKHGAAFCMVKNEQKII